MYRTNCPPTHRWSALLADDLPPAEQADLNGHLELCPACQRTLEECAAGREDWASARTLGAMTQPRSHVLDDVIDGLKFDPESDHAHHDGAELPVDFLDPPSEPPGSSRRSLGRIHQYEVLEEIGRGGMGVVLKALDPGLHRVVAIKVLAPQLAVSGTARKRFTREARAAAAIGHENVVTIHAVEEFKGLPYLVMQYIAGPSVQQRIATDGSPPIADILRFGFQTAAGLAAAHAQGLIHRDVKPANILLENGVGRVKLTDFSLARAIDDASVTQSGVVTGTPPFMAPEQARGEPLDHRADLFSLGSVLYALCTGRPPFRGQSLDVLRKVSEETPVSIRRLNPEIPNWLESIVNKLMAKNPDGRYQSAGEVAAVLEQCLAHVQQPQTVSLPTIPQAAKRKRHWLAIALPILAGIFVVAAVIIMRLRTAHGTLEVAVDDPNATVTVDGTDIVVTGIAGVKEFRLKAGDYTVHETKAGKPEKTEIVSIKQNEKTPLRVTFEPDGRAVAVENGRLEQMLLALRMQKKEYSEILGPDNPRMKEVDARIEEVQKLFKRRADGARSATNESLSALTAELDQLKALLAKARADAESTKAELAATKAFLSKELVAEQQPVSFPVTQWKRAFPTALGEVSSAAFSPDGKLLLVADWGGKLRCYDFATGRERFALESSKSGQIRFIAIAPDGQTFAAVGTDKSVRFRDMKTGDGRQNLSGKAAPYYAVAISPDGKTLAAGGCGPDGRGGLLELWDLASGKVRSVEFPDSVLSLAFPPNGEDRLAVGTNGENVRMIYPSTGKQEYSLSQPGMIRALAFSPDGRRLAASGVNQVHLWDWGYSREVATLVEGHAGRVTTVQFSPDGNRLLTASLDGTAKLWHMASQQCVATFAPGTYKTGIGAALFTLDGKSIVTAGDDGMIRVWDLITLRANAAGVPGQSRETTPSANDKEPPMKTVVSALLGLGLSAGAPAALAGENILQNASFEAGAGSPAHWSQGADIDGVEYLWDKQHAHQGKASVCLNKTAKRYFPVAQWYQIVDRAGDKSNLKVAAQVKTENATKAILDVVFLDEKGECISHKWAGYVGAKQPSDPPVSHDWKEYAGSVEIPKGTKKIQVCLQIYGPGKVWFDDVRAEYGD